MSKQPHRLHTKSTDKQRLVLALVILVIAVVGVYFLTGAHAASPYAASEAENGAVTAPATTVSDNSASGGKAVQFGVSGGGGGQNCTNPTSTIPMDTSNPQTGVTEGNFFVTNDTWNAAGYPGLQQTLYVCNYNNWYATATMNNNTGDGAVKTYPNVHQDFIDWGTGAMPKISSYSTISSSFGEVSPPVGIYEYAYDIWLNGVADAASTEVMIWNDNYNQVPGGSKVATFSDGGITYNVYRAGTNGNWQYVAFEATTNNTSGTVNLLDFFNYLMSTKAWIPTTSTIGQVCYGVELVSTNNQPTTFAVNNFSLAAN